MSPLARSEPGVHPGRWRVLLTVLLGLWLLGASPVLASPEAQLRQAISHLERQEYVQALELLHQAERGLPEPTRVAGLLGTAYLGYGYQLLHAGQFAAAREAFAEGRGYAPEDVRYWQGEAMAWFSQGRYADAVGSLDQALGVDAANSETYELLGKAYYADGRLPEALDALTRAGELGAAERVEPLLAKVRSEWQIEAAMQRDASGHFLLAFADGGQAELAPQILDELEGIYAELGADLAFYPDVKVPVLLYTRQAFSAVTRSPDWAGGVYDGKIRIPLGGVREMDPHLRALLYHEYAHVLVRFLGRNRVPTWLNEGVAELAGRRAFDPPLTRLALARQEGRLLAWDRLAGSFIGLPADQVLLAYEQSYALTRFMVGQYGWHTLADLLRLLGTGREFRAAVSAAMDDFGLDWDDILAEWQLSRTD